MVGGLVVKINHNGNFLVGSIGLVVIAKEERGKGYSKLLLRKTIEVCKTDKLDYLLLWTSQHNYYSQFGFELDEPLIYLDIEEQVELVGIQNQDVVDFDSQPTYTQSQGYFIWSKTSVSYLYDGSGYIFVDYNGDVTEAATIITHRFNMPHSPRVILPKNNPLIKELYNRQPNLIQNDHGYEMWLKLKNNICSRMVYKFLQRI